MLITLLILIAIVLIALIITKVLSRDGSENAYSRRRSKKKEPNLSKAYEPMNGSEDDSDVVLGLKSVKNPADFQPIPAHRPQSDHIITLNLLAPRHVAYGGYELLQAILSHGLRFGSMKIFHRHEERSGRGPVLFSMASIAEPGTFELSKMGGYSTPGLSFFLRYDQVEDPRQAFDVMVTTISDLRDELGGDIFDIHQHQVNKVAIGQLYQKIDHFLEAQADVNSEV